MAAEVPSYNTTSIGIVKTALNGSNQTPYKMFFSMLSKTIFNERIGTLIKFCVENKPRGNTAEIPGRTQTSVASWKPKSKPI